MNRSIFTLFFSVFFPTVVFAQEIYIGSAKFILPVVERWIAEYKKENPESQISIKTEQPHDTDGLFIVANQVAEKGNDKTIYFGKYALIPVSNPKNSILRKAVKGFKKRDLTKFVVENYVDEDDFPDEIGNENYTVTVYSRKGDVATSITLAKAFRISPDRIKGKKVVGDEIFLSTAIQKDESGIAFNTMNYVFDIHSRKLKSGLSILPLNIASKDKKIIESQDLDQVILLLEEKEIDEIPVDKYGLRISENLIKSTEVQNFLEWLLTHSPRFNHQYGFLNLNEEELTKQRTW